MADQQFGAVIDAISRQYVSPATYKRPTESTGTQQKDTHSWFQRAFMKKAASLGLTTAQNNQVHRLFVNGGINPNFYDSSVQDIAALGVGELDDQKLEVLKDWARGHSANNHKTQLPEVIHRETPLDELYASKDHWREITGDPTAIPMTDAEILYKQNKTKGELLNDFHQWIHSKYDYTNPVIKEWLNRTYPDFFKWKKETMMRDHDIEWQRKKIDNFGPDGLQELIFQFMMDSDMIHTADSLKKKPSGDKVFTRGGERGTRADPFYDVSTIDGVGGREGKPYAFQKMLSQDPKVFPFDKRPRPGRIAQLLEAMLGVAPGEEPNPGRVGIRQRL